MTVANNRLRGHWWSTKPHGCLPVATWRCTARLLWGLLLAACVAGCAFVDKPTRPMMYDFGPGRLGNPVTSAADSLGILALSDVEVASALDNTAVVYRLIYTDAQQLLPYAQARWSMAPAQLVRQRLREVLGQHRTVLSPGDGNVTGPKPAHVLRVELEEFSQLFDAPGRSFGLVRLRATLVQGLPGGDRLLGQRSFVVQRPAPSPDAAGGVHALTVATNTAVEEIEQWLSQFP
ncbi:MAG: membrane integrity-associated transporter subunit PqiC [Rhodoferax sp.]|nr:membrane integrity-associated transporter subunit PqiC [Rhodoferax sp.]